MKLVVFGANGPTGRKVVEQALAAGHHVAAVTRKPDDYPMRSPQLNVVAADVTDPSAVTDAITGTDAVISTYGVPYSRKKITVYSEGITNIITAMNDAGITRLVCVTSTTVATDKAPDEALLWRVGIHPLLRHVLGRTLYNDMQHMEDIVHASNLDWTIVRPGGLFDTDHSTGDYEVAPHRLAGHNTSRADLAATLIHEATTPQHTHATIEVITRSQLPSPKSFFKEAFSSSA